MILVPLPGLHGELLSWWFQVEVKSLEGILETPEKVYDPDDCNPSPPKTRSMFGGLSTPKGDAGTLISLR